MSYKHEGTTDAEKYRLARLLVAGGAVPLQFEGETETRFVLPDAVGEFWPKEGGLKVNGVSFETAEALTEWLKQVSKPMQAEALNRLGLRYE